MPLSVSSTSGFGWLQCWSPGPGWQPHVREAGRAHCHVTEVVASCAVKVVKRPPSVFPPPEKGRAPQRLLQRSFLSLYLLFLVPGSTPRSCSGESPAWGLLSTAMGDQLRFIGLEKGSAELPCEFVVQADLSTKLWFLLALPVRSRLLREI